MPLIKQSISLAVLGAILFTFQLFAFTEPSANPPLGNVPAPLNVSSSGQSKAGGLILNTGGASYGLIVDQGSVGIGTQSPMAKLEIVGGAIKATGGLIIETRTSDPASPETGRMWLRTDL